MGMLMRSFSRLMSMRRAPAASAAAPMPLTSSTCSESQPMAAASATITSLGLAFFTSLITAATNSGLVLTEVSAAAGWPALGFRTTVLRGFTRFSTPPRRAKTSATIFSGSSPFTMATRDFRLDTE